MNVWVKLLIVAIPLVIFFAVFGIGLCRIAAPRTEEEQRRADQEQAEALGRR